MSEEEFYQSTPAKITALYETKIVEPAKRSDYFVALIASSLLASAEEGPQLTADDILGLKYHSKKPVIITHNPDLGAAGDWRHLKSMFKKKAKT